MSKILKISIFLFISIALVACSSEEDKNDKNKSNDNSENQQQKEIQENQILSIGDTGTIYNENLGDYEVTLDSVEFKNKVDDHKPRMETFVIADITIKNISDKTFKVEDINTPRLYESEDMFVRHEIKEFINNPEGEIAPGKSIKGQILFDQMRVRSYQLVFGNSTYSNEVTWEFGVE